MCTEAWGAGTAIVGLQIAQTIDRICQRELTFDQSLFIF